MNDTMNEITAFSPFGGRLVLEEVKGAQERANVPENSIETKAGDDRSMYVYVPASGCPDAKQTQVVMFLRDGADEASAQAAMKEYGLDALAEKEHFVLAFPNPRQSGWSERDAEDMDYNQQFDSISMPGPLFFSNDPADFRRIMPVYKKVKGMADEYLSDCIKKAVALILADKDSFEYLESSALERLGVPAFKRFLPMVHAPQGDSDLKISERRKIVDELFPFAMKMTQRKGEAITQSIYQVQDRNLLDTFVHNLPYQLTKDQNAAIQEIVSAMESGRRVDALVQGDVGCGKTVVAMALCVVMAHNGFQSAVMAPTTVLAEQHYKKFRDALAPLGITVDYLVSGMSAKERSQILSSIEKGETQVVVGTHAVIADAVKFKSLGLTIVDEEHRFGVEQRGLLQQKAKDGVHSVSMTATPIPRTLAVTLYGENTRIINIRSMPSGRKPVITVINSKPEKVWAAMHRQINEGHQCYVVCPLIEESDNDALTGVASAEEISKQLKNWFAPYPEVTVDLITGDLKKETIQKRLEAFAKGKSQILVSTTIVEVGVDVPNATVMVIQNAERFGLAQLHQLRGRVGRGKAQGYCVLLSQKKESSRLQIMTETSDGFEIAQSDLEMRGSGNWVGTKQHGFERSIISPAALWPCRRARERSAGSSE